MNDAKNSLVRFGPRLSLPVPGRLPIWALALAVSLLALHQSASGGSAQDAQPKDIGRISGTVVNSATNEPIGHALVFSPDERFATMTDNNGRFELTFPQSDSIGGGAQAGFTRNYRPYALTARKPGFLTEPDEPQQNLMALPPGKDVTIPLVPEALIVGHVALPTSEAPESIQVEIYRRQVQNGRARWVPMKRETTRSNGNFRFAELPAGSYKVFTRESLDRDTETDQTAQLNGYPPVYFPNAKDFASAATIQLTPGKVTEVDLSLLRQPYYRIKLPVANAQPGPPLGITVSLQGHEGPGYSLGYDSQQQAIIGMLPSGSYRLDAASYGAAALSGTLNVTVNGPLAGPVMVVVPDSPIKVNVREEFTSAQGEGPGATNNPRRSIEVRAARSDVNVTLEPVNDFAQQRGLLRERHSGPQNDSYVIEHVQPGRYWVQVYSPRGYPYSVTSGGVDLRHQPLVVPAGVSVGPIEVTLRDDTGEIDGTIEGATTSAALPVGTLEGSGQTSIPVPPLNAHIYCIPLPDSTGRFTEALAGPDGRFTVASLAPGEYRLLAFTRRQTLEYENPEAMRAYDGKGQMVRVSGGQKEQVQLHLIPAGE